MSYQLARIDYEKNKALGIFTKTRERFLKAIERAKRYIAANDQKISSLEQELREVSEVNLNLTQSIKSMDEHVAKINHLIGE